MEGPERVSIDIPKNRQGYTFAVDVRSEGTTDIPRGPYRVVFVLTSAFLIFEDDLSAIVPEEGFSYARLATPGTATQVLTAHYTWSNRPGGREARVSLRSKNNLLQAVVVEIPEEEIEVAALCSGQIVANLLDALAFIKRIPIQIRHVDVFPAAGRRLARRYATFPFGQVNVDEQNFRAAASAPPRLLPSLRHVHQAIGSTQPPLRMLSLCSAFDSLKQVRAQNNADLTAKRITPDRPKTRVPDDEVIRQHFPSFLGKPAYGFLERVYSDLRKHVAHPNLDAAGGLVVDPAKSLTHHEVDWNNEAMLRVLWELIRDEWSLMERHGIR